MSGMNLNFDDKKTRKSTFYKNKKIINIEDTDINNTLVFKKEAYSTKNPFKYFIGYKHSEHKEKY